MFILFDGRARFADTEDAAVLDTFEGKPRPGQMRKAARDFGTDTIWFEYDLADDGKTLINERMRTDLS